MSGCKFTINFMGDTMLGRLIDQLFRVHVHEPSEASIIKSFLSSNPQLRDYAPKSPWGTVLPMMLESDLNILNLETAVTSHRNKWPNKTFNYRMHPDNLNALKVANVDYAGLANNHTLDFSEEGLLETVKAVKEAGIAYAGAAATEKEADQPAVLTLPRKSPSPSNDCGNEHKIHIWAASDHPSEWAKIPLFNFISYSHQTKTRLKSLIAQSDKDQSSRSALKIFSVHWGPNYAWTPAKEIQSLAHYLIDECGVDIIHGHSSHHVQGVEKYNGKLIIYGCGDFVDDYALVPDFRNDLSAVWRVRVAEENGGLKLETLEVFPTAIKKFQAQRLVKGSADHEWTIGKVRALSDAFGTKARENLGDDGQLIFDL